MSQEELKAIHAICICNWAYSRWRESVAADPGHRSPETLRRYRWQVRFITPIVKKHNLVRCTSCRYFCHVSQAASGVRCKWCAAREAEAKREAAREGEGVE
jgi:hypothetical protein